jgi:uncharacterized membrane protein YfcA
MSGNDLAGVVIAFGIAATTTPAGVSGAVLLFPVQVSVLGTPSPAVTPTNLLYNVMATPGGLFRNWRTGALRGGLARTLASARFRAASPARSSGSSMSGQKSSW